GYAGTVHFASSDGQAMLPVNSTLPNGTGTFSITLKTAGSQSLTATDTATGTLTCNAAGSVSPASSGALVFNSADLPQTINPVHAFIESFISVPQSVTIASVKVQLNVSFPRDSELTIELWAPNGTRFGTSVILSDQKG